MTDDTAKPSRPDPIVTPLQKRAFVCREIMGFCVKWWLILFCMAFIFGMMRVNLAPFDFISLSLCTCVFVLASLMRLICIARFALLGQEMRSKDEIVFLPQGVTLNLTQRLYMGAGMALWDSGWSIPASLLLMILSHGPMSGMGFLAASTGLGMLLIFCGIFTVAVLLRLTLIHLHGLNFITIYDPNEKLNRIDPEAPDKPGVSPRIMRLLMLFRRGGYMTIALILPGVALMAVLPSAATSLLPVQYLQYARWMIVGLQCACLGTLCYFALLQFTRFVLIAWVVAKYSIAHVLCFNMVLGLFVSLSVTNPSPWNVLSGGCAAITVFVALYYISTQDPEGEKYVPEFIKARKREQRRARREKKKLEDAAPPPNSVSRVAN
jgi:hypothetical protein